MRYFNTEEIVFYHNKIEICYLSDAEEMLLLIDRILAPLLSTTVFEPDKLRCLNTGEIAS